VEFTFWAAGEAVSVTVIGLMFFRRLWRSFPLFFAYVSWSLLGDLIAYVVISLNHSLYTPAYLTLSIVDSILLFGVLVELAWAILRPLRASLSRTALIPVLGVVLAVGAAVWPFGSLTLAGTTRGTQLIVHLQQTVSILQIIFLLVLIGSSQLLSIGWRDRELQVATGLGFYSFVNIGVAALQRYQASYAQYRYLNEFVIGAFLCTLLYWVVCFAQKEAERRAFTPQMQSFLLSVAGAAHSTRVALTPSRSGKTPGQEKH
jgi:hypothetical protein